jgi:murein DD-endopeptidase MepM/ murein hydrolase activator NlpD
MGAVAMTFAAALMVSVSLPALAVNPSGNLLPLTSSAASGEEQRIDIGSDVTITPIQRDSYTAGKAETTADYAQTASTFVNFSGPIQWPFLTGVPISTDFGYRVPPCSGCSSYHKGIDMNPGDGAPIQAIADGVVREVSATDNGGLGVYAVIDHTTDGELVSSVYAHMTEGSLALSVGQRVAVGDLVGTVGNTGQSTGPHLHFEILLDGVTPTDPFAWLTERVVP